ncbi:hypothetical protein BGZ65_006553, partial [Modicella reniformis]
MTSWSAFNTTIALVLLFVAGVLPETSRAQQPDSVWGMSVARVGPYLFFQGGSTGLYGSQTSVTSQLAALPLDTSWATHSPPWKQLAPGNAFFSVVAVATTDNQTMITFAVNSPSLGVGWYGIQRNSWKYASVATPEALVTGFRPVVDPESSWVYIAGKTLMNIYIPQTDRWQSRAIPNNTLTQRIYGGAVYNSARKTIMYFGGYSDVFEPETYITEYKLSTGTWSILNTTGDIPPPIADICMAASEDGNTVAIFGGRYFTINRFKEPDVFSGSLYLLDVQNKVWSKTSPLPARAYVGCEIIGDQFVLWGGADDMTSALPYEPPLVYDLTKKQWVDSYTAPAYYQAGSNNTSNPDSSNNHSNSDIPNNVDTTQGDYRQVVIDLRRVAVKILSDAYLALMVAYMGHTNAYQANACLVHMNIYRYLKDYKEIRQSNRLGHRH